MRKILFLSLVLVSSLAAAAGAQTGVGVMTGANEAPGPGDPDGFGLAGFRFEGTTISYTIMVKGIDAPSASHIHRGTAGVPGPIVITLASSFPNNTATGVANASAALIQEIVNNPEGFYVNVHNAAFPNGAIRAQLTGGAFAFATGAAEAPGRRATGRRPGARPRPSPRWSACRGRSSALSSASRPEHPEVVVRVLSR
jgi:hypothetical protein